MDVDEWDHWFTRHKTLLPQLQHWFGAMGRDEQVEVMKAWHQAMADLTLAEAMEATDAIVRGDVECKFPSETPKACRLRGLALRLTRRNQKSDSEVVHRFCGLCRGSGAITVWHPLVVRAVRNKSNGVYRHPVTGQQMIVRDAEGGIKGITAAAACKCSLGDRFRDRLPPPAAVIPVQFRERQEYAGLTLEDVIELDIAASPFMVQEWEYA